MTWPGGAADGGLARMGGPAGLPELAPGGDEIAWARPELASVELEAALKGGEVAPCGSVAALDVSSIASYCIDLAFCAHAVAFCYPVVIADPDKAAAMAGKARTEAEKAAASLENAVAALEKANS